MKKILSLLLMSMVAVAVHAEADPNFYIYLCFGQSNMEGNAAAESVDKTVLIMFQNTLSELFCTKSSRQ